MARNASAPARAAVEVERIRVRSGRDLEPARPTARRLPVDDARHRAALQQDVAEPEVAVDDGPRRDSRSRAASRSASAIDGRRSMCPIAAEAAA